MSENSETLWNSDLIVLDEFLSDWAIDEDVQSFNSFDTANTSKESCDGGIRPKSKRAKISHDATGFSGQHMAIVPHSTRKLISILKKLKDHEEEPEMKLYSFVPYDKYDSLVYFPHSLARCYTSANVQAFGKLISRHYHPSCQASFSEQVIVHKPNRRPVTLTITREAGVTARETLNLFEASRDSHPDCVCNIISTTVIGNQIHAVMTYSYTDIPEMYTTTGRNANHPFLRVPQAGNRSTLLAKYLQLSAYSPCVQNQLMVLFDSMDTIVFHVKMNTVYTFQTFPNGHKIVDVQVTAVQNSVEHRGIVYSLA